MNEIKNDDVPVAAGPRKKAPAFYVGETVGRYPTMPVDVERHPNGACPSPRNKIMRRIIRKALLDSHRGISKGLKLVRDMRMQAREVARKAGRSNRWAERLLQKELAIHQPAYVPETKAERRRARNVDDAIANVVSKGRQA